MHVEAQLLRHRCAALPVGHSGKYLNMDLNALAWRSGVMCASLLNWVFLQGLTAGVEAWLQTSVFSMVLISTPAGLLSLVKYLADAQEHLLQQLEAVPRHLATVRNNPKQQW